MKLVSNKIAEIYAIPLYIFLILVLGDRNTLFRSLINFAFPLLIVTIFLLRLSTQQLTVKVKKNGLQVLFIFYISWVLISCLFSQNIPTSCYYFYKTVVFFSLIFIFQKWLDTKQKYFALLHAVFYAGIALSFFIMFNVVQMRLEGLALEGYRNAGMYGNVNSGGFILAMCSVASFLLYILTSKKKYLLSILLFVVAIGFSGSRAALLMLSVTIFVFYFREKRSFIKTFFITCVAITIFILVLSPFFDVFGLLRLQAGNAGRDAIWDTSILIIKDFPLFGIGLGNLKEIGPTYLDKLSISEWRYDAIMDNGIQSSHNMYLETCAETGIIGLILYMIILFKIILHYIRAKSSNAKIQKIYNLLFAMTIAIVARGFFESNGFMCKGWMSLDILFWMFFILQSKVNVLYITRSNA